MEMNLKKYQCYIMALYDNIKRRFYFNQKHETTN